MPCFVLTADQLQYIFDVLIKAVKPSNKKHVFASNLIQNLSVLKCFDFGADADHGHADTFRLEINAMDIVLYL